MRWFRRTVCKEQNTGSYRLESVALLRLTKIKTKTKKESKRGHTHQVRHLNHKIKTSDKNLYEFNYLKRDRRASITVYLFCLDSKVWLFLPFVVLKYFQLKKFDSQGIFLSKEALKHISVNLAGPMGKVLFKELRCQMASIKRIFNVYVKGLIWLLSFRRTFMFCILRANWVAINCYLIHLKVRFIRTNWKSRAEGGSKDALDPLHEALKAKYNN